ncbi:6849_t:CDS:2 [Diversispora eburnea]|uniref:6849_t:CDS:1 n=1 Tax=Diversispora eburnea TaxID=1213867 RepID=A0A9N8V7C7_9GLOM|nr:6849_t:CDS:2 [Diversispora eburnea]
MKLRFHKEKKSIHLHFKRYSHLIIIFCILFSVYIIGNSNFKSRLEIDKNERINEIDEIEIIEKIEKTAKIKQQPKKSEKKEISSVFNKLFYDYDDELFITYQPHGGLNSQRISLCNAITMAYYFKRTLIIPPLILGKPIRYTDFNKYSKILSKLKHSTDFLRYCDREVDENRNLCIEYHNSYTLYQWDELFDFSFIKKYVKVVQLENFRKENLYKLSNVEYFEEIYFLKSNSKFYDENIFNKTFSKGSNIQFLSDLKNISHRLLHFGSVSGSDRITFSLPENLEFSQQLYGSFLPNNPIILSIVENIVESLGNSFKFVSTHVNSRNFMNRVKKNKLMGLLFKEIEEEFQNPSYIHDQTFLESRCKLMYPDKPDIVLYIATDVEPGDKIINDILQQFPCTFRLSNFSDHLQPIETLINPLDGLLLSKFLLPLIDLMVAAHSSKVFTFSFSPFDTFLQDYNRFLVEKSKSEDEDEVY